MNESDRFMWYRVLLPDSPSLRSKVGRSSHMAEGESSSGGRCRRAGEEESEDKLQHILTLCQGNF